MVRGPIWHLRTDPFYPEVDEHGVTIPPAAIERSLNPLVDQRAVPLYFDVYDWSRSDLVRDISVEGALTTFPTARNLAGDSPLTIIISGLGQTGLDSLANLILHKIRLVSRQELLICDVELDGRDKVRNVALVARTIIDKTEFATPPLPDGDNQVKRMFGRYDRVRKDQEGLKDATYSELFQYFRNILAPLGREMVIWITKGGDNDSWVHIQDSVKSCCQYVLVMTPDPAWAAACYSSMIILNKNVSWVRAMPLDKAKAREYLICRLAATRDQANNLVQLPALFPFTEEAIEECFKPGKSGAPSGGLEYPIGWLRRTFHRAIADQIEWVHQKYRNTEEPVPGKIDPSMTCIGPEQMKSVRDKLNGRT